jgi:hypothetical protein
VTQSTEPPRVRPAPSWVAPLFALLGAATVPWTVYLGATLPDHARTHNYRAAWVGFDIMLVLALLLTAFLAWRGRRSVALVAASTATMLLLDAWFDVLTSDRTDMASAVVSALLAEIPLSILCGWIALHADRIAERRLHQLTRRVVRLQNGDLGTAGRSAVKAAASAVKAAQAGIAIADVGGQTADAATRAAEARLRE